MNILITGGTGYIGTRLTEFLIKKGHKVTFLGSSSRLSSSRNTEWRLGMDPPKEAICPEGSAVVDAVIHLAHDWSNSPGVKRINIEGTRILIEAARFYKVPRFVFCSSLAAKENALTQYGQIKHEIQLLLTAPGELSARVGLVYGGPETAMWGSICAMLRLSPILPIIGARKLVQPIHLDEVCFALLNLALIREPMRSIYNLGSPDGIELQTFMRLVSRKLFCRNVHLFPVPIFVGLFVARLLGFVPGLPKIDRERIMGIANISFSPSLEDLDEIGLKLEPIETILKILK